VNGSESEGTMNGTCNGVDMSRDRGRVTPKDGGDSEVMNEGEGGGKTNERAITLKGGKYSVTQ